jgi:hypothetical protein
MSFGDDSPQQQMAPPPLPPPPPSAPQFATGLSKVFKQGRPFGGTLLTSPLAVAQPTNLDRKSLVTS